MSALSFKTAGPVTIDIAYNGEPADDRHFEKATDVTLTRTSLRFTARLGEFVLVRLGNDVASVKLTPRRGDRLVEGDS